MNRKQIHDSQNTTEEYLKLETTAEYKNEYRNGKIVQMTGGSVDHNKIAGNLYAYLKFTLRQQPYNGFIGDIQL